MAHAVEGRLPFLDHKVAEFSAIHPWPPGSRTGGGSSSEEGSVPMATVSTMAMISSFDPGSYEYAGVQVQATGPLSGSAMPAYRREQG